MLCTFAGMTSESRYLEILNPTSGIVICKQILNFEDQLKFIDLVHRKGGLKTDTNEWNFFGKRGRCFERLSKYPADDQKFLNDCFQKFKEIVETADKTLVFPSVTHILTLYYPGSVGIGWHIDGYGGNDGDIGAPVFSLTLGNTCLFQYKLVKTNVKIDIELRSGDLIVFGGPQRLMYHSVKQIYPKSFSIDFNARINITARTCSDLTLDDDIKYETENYVERSLQK